MGRKRDAARLQDLTDRYGDFKPFELLERLRNPRPGRPQKDLHTRVSVYLTVEAMMAAGLKPTKAWRACAKHLKISENIVQKVHGKGSEDFGPIFKPHAAEILRLHLEGNVGGQIKGDPELKAICDKIKKATAKTPAIRGLIRR